MSYRNDDRTGRSDPPPDRYDDRRGRYDSPPDRYDDRSGRYDPPSDRYGRPRESGGYRADGQSGRRDPQYDYPPQDYGRYEYRQPPGQPRPPEKKGLSRNAKIGIGGGVFLFLVVIGLAAGGGEETSTASSVAVVAPANTAGVPVAGPTTAPAAAPAPAAVAPATDSKAVPNVVGLDHQLAQDTLQAAGFYYLAEEDATGQGRALILDRNWQVVSQEPAAGTVIGTDHKVLLRSKKDTDP